jgi:hypothetical protein
MKALTTEKDYKKSSFKLSFAVVTKEGIVMSSGFISKKEAEDFRDNSFFGYYRDCEVKLCKNGIMSYDDWKLEAPEDEPEYECPVCSTPLDRETYCSRDCYKADMQ